MSETVRNRPTWAAESTHPALVESVTEALRTVIDPEIGMNVIELGLVRDLSIAEDGAELTMIMTTPFCPYAPAMLEMTRVKAEGALNLPTRIKLGMEMWDFSMMEEGVGGDWGLY